MYTIDTEVIVSVNLERLHYLAIEAKHSWHIASCCWYPAIMKGTTEIVKGTTENRLIVDTIPWLSRIGAECRHYFIVEIPKTKLHFLAMLTNTVIFSNSISGPGPAFALPLGRAATISTSIRLTPGSTLASYNGRLGSFSSALCGIALNLCNPRITKILLGRCITWLAMVGTIRK